jgi:hypothetical protein
MPATVTLLAGFAVALVGATGGIPVDPPRTSIVSNIGSQAGGMHMYPPHTPVIKG